MDMSNQVYMNNLMTGRTPSSMSTPFSGQQRLSPSGDMVQGQGYNPQTGQWEDLYTPTADNPMNGHMTDDNTFVGLRPGSDQFLQSQLGNNLNGFTLDRGTGQQPQGDAIGDMLVKLMMGGVAGGAAFGGFDALAGGAGGTAPLATGSNGLDAIGNMVTQVPQGSTFGGYASSLGMSPEELIGSMSPVAGGAASGGSNALTDSEKASLGQSDVTATGAGSGMGSAPFSISNMFSSIFGGSGAGSNTMLGKVTAAMGLPAGVGNAAGQIFNIGSGIYGMTQADQMKKRAQLLAQQADPFASSRPQYVSQLNSLMADPSTITTMPGYKAGLQAVERRGAAQGWNGSGNMMTSMADYGGNFFNQAVQQLMGLSGANVNPVSAANLALSGQNDAASVGAQSMNRIGYGLTQRDPTTDLIMNMMINRMRS